MDILATKMSLGKVLGGNMSRGITYDEFVSSLKENTHVVIDLRTKAEISEIVISSVSLEMDAEDIPNDSQYLPSYFKENYVIVLCSDGEVSKKGVENFFEQDPSLTKMFYIIGGHKGLPTDV